MPSARSPEEEAARLSAFVARSGFHFEDKNTLIQALTHSSHPEKGKETGQFYLLGEKLLSLYAAEYVYARFPRIPATSLKTMVESYTGHKALKDVAATFGVNKVMRWKGAGRDDRTGEGVASARVLQALIGALHQEKGAEAARHFIHAHFLSRRIEPANHFTSDKPGRDLNFLQLSKGHPKPIPRLLAETGRDSNYSMFLVGYYSGLVKISEGHGTSMKMADFRAAMDGLRKHFLEEERDIKLPSDIDMGIREGRIAEGAVEGAVEEA
ncbi:hypothetical protein HK097_004137 [Rhizophlyctis rosea]|uniref:Large ribosomal subunit protein mL44 n=1 Tax=Rhizophlyctis rosea TaxID=64517 RepID=A0AAD5X2V3_9FUNG|nr:hypothetical protein HK097_004137 [Rhizophlyctis rosea]